jgi:hypothetical protein
MHGETRGFPLLLLRVGRGDGSLHNDMEQIVALPSHGGLREGNDELQGLQSMVDLGGDGSGVPERLGELLIDPVDLRVDFTAVTRRLSLMSKKRHTKSTHLLSTTKRSSTCKFRNDTDLKFHFQPHSTLIDSYV